MMKPGDTVTHYANPRDCTSPEQVKLAEKVRDFGVYKQWWFNYLDEPCIKRTGLFKNDDNGTHK